MAIILYAQLKETRAMSNEQTIYQIKIQGRLDEEWSEWFNEMTVTSENDITTLTGTVADQAVLRGILDKIWDLNLVLISVIRIETNAKDGSQTQQ
jgi:hypothetical protein